MKLIGFVGMVDPTRDSAKVAVARCKEAGIRVIVLTGDNHSTAKAVCNELRILNHNRNQKQSDFYSTKYDSIGNDQDPEEAAK